MIAAPTRILVADDLPYTRMLVREVFELEGWDVMCAVTGENAMDLHEIHGPFDVYVLDNLMPPGRLTGLDVTRKLRAQGVLVPIVLHTGSGLMREAHDAGARYCPKGAIEGLVHFVQSVLEEAAEHEHA